MIISVGYRVKSKRGVAFRQKDMAMLFDVSTDNIGLHIANILDEGELDNSTTEKSSVVQTEEKRQVKRNVNFYNLDMIISDGNHRQADYKLATVKK